ncbi:hypothetical protein NET03_08015 [Thermomicrobium sp. CFH 73360]|uniref:hypothetical protein n=1 Tax=Thermomicrobium sp. CFH 73360 TaxID=2951987 RepID=UPI0020773C02|nr:hypothetical protein [Thermomicrobium sp. CFH 73360]MCM8746478.1 hypothetical protein [Thermomicrobium sp. CFH 73360]
MHLCHDPLSDRLVLALDVPDAPSSCSSSSPLVTVLSGILDVADEGHILGLELPLDRLPTDLRTLLAPLLDTKTLYLELEGPQQPRVVRSVPVPVELHWRSEAPRLTLSFPRRTREYELLYPSGTT